jgi:hypothetical protein
MPPILQKNIVSHIMDKVTQNERHAMVNFIVGSWHVADSFRNWLTALNNFSGISANPSIMFRAWQFNLLQ